MTSRGEPIPLETLHAIAFLGWEREWYETFEVRRARLLDTLSRLSTHMESDSSIGKQPMKSFLLGGQTVILEDIAEVRPDLVTRLVIYNAGGRLGVGPWYVIVDEALVSGESLIRNLQAARTDAEMLGLKLMPVVYDPSASGHSPQLPQILRDFDIDGAFLRHGTPIVHLPFRWEASDGSSILVVNHERHTNWESKGENLNDVVTSVKTQQEVRPDGPFLWLFDVDNPTNTTLAPLISEINDIIETPVIQSDLKNYVQALRDELPDTVRPSLTGELRMQALQENTYLLPGTLSARIYLKQQNARLQAFLSHSVEPWLAILLSQGKVEHASNLRSLLNYSWRLLLKNQARNSLGGCCHDAVHQENEIRFGRIRDTSNHVLESVMQGLPGTRHASSVFPKDVDKTYVVVWNSHNWSITQVVETHIELPPNKHIASLLDPHGGEHRFAWQPGTGATNDGTLIFLAQVPAIGYSTYTIELSDEPLPEQHLAKVRPGHQITNISGETLSVTDDGLVWHYEDQEIPGLIRFFDGGDAGDVYNYSPPKEDVIVEADLLDEVKTETSPLYERLIIRHRMRVAPSLNTERKRSRGLKLIELTTTVTFYDHMPGIYFKTEFHNLALDHRLRVHLNTNLRPRSILVDTPFGTTKRTPFIKGAAMPPPNAKNMEGVVNTQPLQTFVAVSDHRNSVAVLSRDLPEYEIIREHDNKSSIALTLVRSVGWLSRDDLRTRTGMVAPMIAVPGAQCQREITAEYALVPTKPNDKPALLRAGFEYRAPPLSYQYDAPPKRVQRSYLSILSDQAKSAVGSDGEGAIVTAFKPPEKGHGWIIRMFNPHDHPVQVFLLPYRKPKLIYKLNMAEKAEEYYEPDANGQVTIHIDPHKIYTVRVTF